MNRRITIASALLLMISCVKQSPDQTLRFMPPSAIEEANLAGREPILFTEAKALLENMPLGQHIITNTSWPPAIASLKPIRVTVTHIYDHKTAPRYVDILLQDDGSVRHNIRIFTITNAMQGDIQPGQTIVWTNQHPITTARRYSNNVIETWNFLEATNK